MKQQLRAPIRSHLQADTAETLSGVTVLHMRQQALHRRERPPLLGLASGTAAQEDTQPAVKILPGRTGRLCALGRPCALPFARILGEL